MFGATTRIHPPEQWTHIFSRSDKSLRRIPPIRHISSRSTTPATNLFRDHASLIPARFFETQVPGRLRSHIGHAHLDHLAAGTAQGRVAGPHRNFSAVAKL